MRFTVEPDVDAEDPGSPSRSSDVGTSGARTARVAQVKLRRLSAPRVRKRTHSRFDTDMVRLDNQRMNRELLLLVSRLHTLLALSPVTTIEQHLELLADDSETLPIRRAVDHAVGHYKFYAKIWFGAGLGFVVCLPPLYANFAMPVRCTSIVEDACGLEEFLLSPAAFFIGPCLFGASVALLFSLDALLHCIGHLDCLSEQGASRWRQWIRSPLYSAFFVLRARMPSLQFNDFGRFVGVPDHAVKLSACFGYIALLCELVFIAIRNHDFGQGLVVAYAMGEVYCKVLDWLLAPPQQLIEVVQAELRHHEPSEQRFWLRLYENNEETFSLTMDEAEALAKLARFSCVSPGQRGGDVPAAGPTPLVSSAPRHIKHIYFADLNEFVSWDAILDEMDLSASETGSDRERSPSLGARWLPTRVCKAAGCAWPGMEAGEHLQEALHLNPITGRLVGDVLANEEGLT